MVHTDTRRQVLRQQIKSYVEDELSSHETAARIGGSPDGESTLRCVGGVVYTYGLAPIVYRPMTYLIMVPISKFRSRMDGCALHVYPGHLIPYVQRRLLPGVSTRVVYHMQGTCMENLKAGTVRDTPTREVGGAQRFSQHLLTASPKLALRSALTLRLARSISVRPQGTALLDISTR